MSDEFDDFGGFDDDDGFVPAEMAAADAHGAEEFEDFGDDDFFDDDAEGREGGEGGGGDEDAMDGFEDDDWGSDDGGGAAGGDGDAMDGFGDEEEADSGGAAPAPAADAAVPAKQMDARSRKDKGFEFQYQLLPGARKGGRSFKIRCVSFLECPCIVSPCRYYQVFIF